MQAKQDGVHPEQFGQLPVGAVFQKAKQKIQGQDEQEQDDGVRPDKAVDPDLQGVGRQQPRRDQGHVFIEQFAKDPVEEIDRGRSEQGRDQAQGEVRPPRRRHPFHEDVEKGRMHLAGAREVDDVVDGKPGREGNHHLVPPQGRDFEPVKTQERGGGQDDPKSDAVCHAKKRVRRPAPADAAWSRSIF